MKSIKSFLTLVFFLFSVTLFAQRKSATSPGDFYLEYSSSTKTVVIKGSSVTIKEWIEQYDNPVSSMPGARKEVIKTSTLSTSELNRLKSLIRSSGFMSLPKNEYGASSSERFYPYTLSITTGGKQKKVVYRSNPDPSTEPSPKAFSEIEKKMNELIVR